MKLLLKVVKSSQVFSGGDAVDIDNKIIIPQPLSPEFSPEEMDEAELIAWQRQEEEKRIEKQISTEVERRVAFLRSEIDNEKNAILNNARDTRVEMINSAIKEAAKIVAKANAEAPAIREQALKSGKEDGYEQGYKLGKDEAVAQCEKYVQAAAQFLAGINAKKDAYFVSLEDDILNTVIDMVKKITLDELKTDKETIFRILKQAAKAFRNDDYVKISFAAGDVSRDVVTDLNFMRTVIGSIKDIDIEILPEADEGTVIIDNGSEIIDASVPSQLDLLKEIMNNSRG